MNSPHQFPSLKVIFLTAVTLALLFALYTNHVWEDYYITFRSSKNLATGHGLVYNHGDKLHTFTSPLGVLLPAVCSLITGNSSDTAALWVFRAFCATAFGGAITILVGLMRRLSWPALASGLLALLLMTDAKSLDFTINGMETAFMLLFLVYAIWAHLSPGPRQWIHLGAAWAGLMWTRPDSFIYIGLIAVGFWIFNQSDRTGSDRRDQFILFLKAGILTTALYGPWLIWANWYYGTPVPHTIVAKAAMSGEGEALQRLLSNIWKLPVLIWQGTTSAEGSFLPSYHIFPTWPSWTPYFGRLLGLLASFLWLVPRLRLESRIASFAYFGATAYLSFVPYFPFPWYLPATTLLAWISLIGAAGQLWQLNRSSLRWLLGACSLTVTAACLFLTVAVSRQARAHQIYIEDGNRRQIGEWLHKNAEPGDTVFMEPLGYIGYFSGLKTYDWPGMSSREMPDTIPLVGKQWGDIILYLQPDWLVLRTDTSGDLPQVSRILNAHAYDRIKEFNRRPEIESLNLAGKNFLLFDSQFTVYRRRTTLRHDIPGYEIASTIPSGIRTVHGKDMRLIHAPGYMIGKLPKNARTLKISYGFPDDAFTGNTPSNGANFIVWIVDGRSRTILHSHRLEPNLRPKDRGLHTSTIELPKRQNPENAHLVFQTDDMGDNAKDWTFWSTPEFK